MEFGLMFSFRNPPRWEKPWDQLYGESLEQIVRAEELGFDAVWLTEHHFTDDGYLPSLLTMATAVAVKTRRVRIGTYVLLLPLHHPVRVAEDAAVVDILSGGRLTLGLGVGYRAEEFAGFNIPRTMRERLQEEGVEILQKCFTEERFDYNGRYYQLRDVSLSPKPLQKHYPPLYLGGVTRPVLRRAARLGVQGLCGRPTTRSWQHFREAMAAHGRNIDAIRNVGLQYMYVAETDEQAIAEAGDHAEWVRSHYAQWFAEAGSSFYSRTVAEEFIIGSPETCIRRLEAWLAERDVPVHHVVVQIQFAGLEHAKALRAMELFARHILPHFRDH